MIILSSSVLSGERCHGPIAHCINGASSGRCSTYHLPFRMSRSAISLWLLVVAGLNKEQWVGASDRQPAPARTCGAKALVSVLTENGVRCELDGVLARLPHGGEDSSLKELFDSTHAFPEVTVIGMDWYQRPPVGAPPAIVSVSGRNGLRHFIAVLAWEAERVLLQDNGEKSWVPVDVLRQIGWDGAALHISTDINAITRLKPRWFDAEAVKWAIAFVCLGASASVHSWPHRDKKSKTTVDMKVCNGEEI